MQKFISFNKIKLTSFFIIISIIQADDGDLISYNHQNTLSLMLIEILLDGGGISGSNPIYPISIYEIAYESHRPDGTIDTLAGLISIPKSIGKAFPIASYQHGTVVLDENAPSITGATVNNYEVLLVALMASPAGLITLFPDYEGLGDPNKYHPYIIANSYTRAVVNMVRAVKELSFTLEGDDQFQFNEQLFLFGYSEGGYATLAAQKGIQFNFSDELTVTASFPMAGPYNLSETTVDFFLSIPNYDQPYYVPYVLTSHLWYYDGLDADFNQYFEPFWADTLAILFDGTHSGVEINEIMPEEPLDIILPDVLEDFINNEENIFNQTFRQNTLLDWVPNSPTYLYHGMGDDIVPYQNTQVIYQNFIDNEAENVELILFPEILGGHSELIPVCLLSGFNTMLTYQNVNEKGDVDENSTIDAEDLSLLENFITSDISNSSYSFWAMDMNFDHSISVFDLLMLIDIIEF